MPPSFQFISPYCFASKNTRLLGHPSLDVFVTSTNDGYFSLYQLAQIGRHPLFNPYPTVLHEPTQNADTDLASYLAKWIQYLTMQALSGHFLSDCYFIIKFVAGLHPSLCFTLGTDLEHHIDHPCYDNHPLPFDFTPAHLWVHLQQWAQFNGFQGQVLVAPHETQQNLNVHQVSTLVFDDTLTIGIDNLVAALTTTSSACFFCHDTSHMAPICPLLLHTKSDSFAWKIVIQLLQDQQPSLPS